MKNFSVANQVSAGLAKISMAIKSKSWEESFPLNITPTQAQTLSILLHHGNKGLRLKELADDLGVTDPTASDVVSVLCEKGLVSKRRTPKDKRAIGITLAEKGKDLAEKMTDWPDYLAKTVESLSIPEKQVFLHCIIKMIKTLQDNSEISPAHMCITCKYFKPFTYEGDKPHHCLYVDQPFGESELRTACPDYKEAQSDTATKRWLSQTPLSSQGTV